MQSGLERRLWLPRGLVGGYWTYLLAHSVFDFLADELDPRPLLLVIALSALASSVVASAPRMLLLGALIPPAVVLAVRYQPWWWEPITRAPGETWATLSSAWTGIAVEATPVAIWTLVGLTAAATAALFYLWSANRVSLWVVVGAGLALPMGQWFYYYRQAQEYLVLLLPVAALAAACSPRAVTPRVRPLLYGALVGALSLALASLAPVPASTWDWGRLGDFFTERIPALAQMQADGDRGFWLGGVGWGDQRQQLGGPVEPSELPLLRVTVEGEWLPDTLYLRGTVSETYDGSGWVDEPEVPPLPEVAYPDGAYPLSQTIQVVNLASRTIFGVWQIEDVAGVDGLERDASGVLSAPQRLDRGHAYSVTSSVPLVTAPGIRAAADSGWPETGMQPYLQLPELPDRVLDLARDLTAGIDHPYDRALALEAYVRGFPYTLDGPLPPPDQDFVDFFLFDARAGYCTYHSTALAVLLRGVGIPSRWVQGFRVALPLDDPLDDDRPANWAQAVVTSERAHAWVETYMPGYGWIIMEPTAGLPLPLRLESLPGIVEPDPLPGPTPPPAPSIWPRARAVAGVLLVALTLLLAAAAWLGHRTPRLDPAATVFTCYRRAASMAGRSLGRRWRAMTAGELAQAVEGGAGAPFATLAGHYQHALYSPHQPSPESARLAVAAYRQVVRAMLKQHGIGWYLLTLLLMPALVRT